jgi:hypothetical protein
VPFFPIDFSKNGRLIVRLAPGSQSCSQCSSARSEAFGRSSVSRFCPATLVLSFSANLLSQNVTYGYTSASFSGRMPHIQVADAIVQYGRESLEKASSNFVLFILYPNAALMTDPRCNNSVQAINLIHSTDRWRARVVYGDTDSLFIHLPGRSKDQAFLIGNEIADAVTARNPKPMKLKFEKVHPLTQPYHITLVVRITADRFRL